MEIKEKTNENAPTKVVNKTTETLIKELETMSDTGLHDLFMFFYKLNCQHGNIIYGDKFNEFLEAFTSNPFRHHEDKAFRKELIENLIKYCFDHMSLLIMTYAYCRVSTKHQRIARQITNITELYPKATIIREFYTGTTQSRPQWDKLISQIKKEDTIVFDSVSRMSRNAEEGFKDYKMLYESGVNLIFLNEPLINTSVFDSTKNNLLNINIETGNVAVDDFFKGNIELINNFMMALAEEQIKTAFDQAEKEVTDLHSRISQGIREAKKNGTQIGISKGTTLTTKKSIECKAIIQKHSKDFGGTLEDPDVIKLCGCSRNSYYKYKKEMKSKNNS